MWNGTDSTAYKLVASLYSGKCDLINIRKKGGVKTVDDVAQANGQANIDNLLRAEMVCESMIRFIIDDNISR